MAVTHTVPELTNLNIDEHEHTKKNLMKPHSIIMLEGAGEVEGVKLQAAGTAGTFRISVSVKKNEWMREGA